MPRSDPLIVTLLGADGMLGRVWLASLRADPGVHLLARTVADGDLCEHDGVERAVSEDSDLVINCTGFTAVDDAESHSGDAHRLNTELPGEIASHCRQIGARFLHYSTDYVFGGDGRTGPPPYRCDEPVSPVNVYGASKAAGEHVIRDSGAEWLIVRTSWLYAAHGTNFVRTILQKAAETSVLRVVGDQIGRPTCADLLVRTSRALLNRGAGGVYHAGDSGECSWYELALHIVQCAGLDCKVTPCTTSDFPRPAHRPSYSVLDLSETDTAVGPAPHWRESVSEIVHRLTRSGSERE